MSSIDSKYELWKNKLLDLGSKANLFAIIKIISAVNKCTCRFMPDYKYKTD